ncbi:hypothetical protein [Candidatus Methylobacter favarea]|uniref:hypothetical protein n=1 Tax=Candidatus Methylobacter favarea TaxID=2707345 RepID=UPI00157DC259|nr:hypothetical protein [Candidatus Methylobacter favarea]
MHTELHTMQKKQQNSPKENGRKQDNDKAFILTLPYGFHEAGIYRRISYRLESTVGIFYGFI